MASSSYEFETLQLYAGQVVDASKARAVPICASASFVFDNVEHMQRLCSMKEFGHVYSRTSNPTNEVFEKRVAALEGGVAALCTASGVAAEFLAIATLCESGDNIISSPFLYGGTHNLFKVSLPRLGISCKFTSGDDLGEFERLIDGRTKAIYIETIGNPKYNVPDIAGLANLAHSKGIPLVVDSTFGMCGFLCKPIDHGADIVIHSSSKWICGHGTTIGGVIVDSGKFPWNNGKFPLFTNPCPSYQGLVFWDMFGPKGVVGANVAFVARCRCEALRDFGPCQNPFASFLLLQGLETLSLRCERHCSNAMALAQHLKSHPKVSWVNYVGLPGSVGYENAKRYFRQNLFGGMLSFGVKGGFESIKSFLNGLKLVSHAADVGDAKTNVVYPALVTHSQLSEEELVKAGISVDLIRVAVGIEHINDIIRDFNEALGAVTLS